MTIELTLVITNVTSVKDGMYGPRVTISLYESTRPDTSTDTVYMVTLGITNEILQGIVDQIGNNEKMASKPVGSRVPIPTGIRVVVSCNNETTSSNDARVKYLNKVVAVRVIGDVLEPVDRVFPARDVVFKDWGVFVQTTDGEFVDDKYLFLLPHLGEKISSLMDRYKVATPADTVRIHGLARLYYSTYPRDKDAKSWVVKAKSRFDSRFDEPGRVTIDMNIDGIKRIYASKLMKLKGNAPFLQIVKHMAHEWTVRFVSEKEMISKGRDAGIDIDVNLMTTSFLENDEQIVFYTMKSMLSDDSDVYYHLKKDLKYIVMQDTGNVDQHVVNSKFETGWQKIIVLDMKFKNIYFFKSKNSSINSLLKSISETKDVLFLENTVTADGLISLENKVKIDTSKKWVDAAWQFVNAFTS